MAATGLSLMEREEIYLGIELDESAEEIAMRIERHRTTVSREIDRNGGRDNYSPCQAHRRALMMRRREKVPKMVRHRELGRKINADLGRGFSPYAASIRAFRQFGYTVVPETIYQAMYVSSFRGVSWTARAVLKSRRHNRRKRNQRHPTGGHFLDRQHNLGWKHVSLRTKQAERRWECGHWEGDLITGPSNKSAVITLAERKSRFVILRELPNGHNATSVADALIEALIDLPWRLRRSLTWDQGNELADWRYVESTLSTSIYFCDPASPWQRPTNENTNRHLRFWLPKKTDLEQYSQEALDHIAHIWNTHPRRIFNGDTAAQRYDALVH